MTAAPAHPPRRPATRMTRIARTPTGPKPRSSCAKIVSRVSASGSLMGSQLRRDGACRLFGRAHGNDLEVDEIAPRRHPSLEHVLALRLHDLEAAAKFEVDPARDVHEAVGRQAAAIPEAPVHGGRLPGAEVLDHHEAHRFS